jgi:MFS family permease
LAKTINPRGLNALRATPDRRLPASAAPGGVRRMAELVSSDGALQESVDRAHIRRLMLFFSVVYVVEGLGQQGGLMAQPLNYYLKQTQGWTPVQVTAALTLFNLPWVIKPLYGLISDFIPLFGYRRKSYLVLANVGASVAFLWVTQLTAPSHLLWALLVTAYAMAISSTLCGAVLVENGQKFGASGRFVNQQWLWFNVASMVAALLGGALIEWLTPTSAMHTAAGIVAVAPLAVIFGSLFLIDEKKSPVNLAELKESLHGLRATFKRRELWLVAFFLFLYFFSPGFSTPLYYQMTDNLHFSQGFIGILSAISSAGWIVGGLVYWRFLESMNLKALLNLSIMLGTVTTAAFIFLFGEISAVVLNFCSGFAAMIATVATLTLAADFCPKRSEGFAFAVLMSVTNFSTSLADNVGSFLYEYVFQSSLLPLVVVSALFTAVAFVLVPLLRLGDKQQGVPIAAVAPDASRSVSSAL